MSSQHNFLRRLLVIGFIVACLLALLPVYVAATFTQRSQTLSTIQVSQSTPGITNPEESHYGLPKRLQIPKIGLDAEVQDMGLTAEGDVEAPKDPAAVGWYKLGPRPGEKGSAVVDGHFGWLNQPSAFDNLHKLNKGDNLYVLDDQGVSVAFVVRESRMYSPEDNTAEIFAQNDGGSHLNLITCEGTWDEAKRTYTQRRVLFTDKIN